jgi:hypothetical protein
MAHVRCAASNAASTDSNSSPLEFNTMLRDWLVDNGWQLCTSDPCIYTFITVTVLAVIALYVDDIPAARNDTA